MSTETNPAETMESLLRTCKTPLQLVPNIEKERHPTCLLRPKTVRGHVADNALAVRMYIEETIRRQPLE
jgi:hypothetical protein